MRGGAGSWVCTGAWCGRRCGTQFPAQRKKTERPALKMAPAVSLIESILELDRKAPRKQRHTSRRIYDRIRAEFRDVRQRSERFGSM